MLCGQCRRCNPTEAQFCWFDGAALKILPGNDGHVDVSQRPFFCPFSFPSGRICRTFEELALTCQEEWSAAAGVLREGFFEEFLSKIGRADLAAVAREGARFPDIDQGLNYFLARIPNKVLPEPKLRVEPFTVNLGHLTVGEDRVFHLHLKNDGKRLLHGWIATRCDWLSIGEGSGGQAKLFQFGSGQSVVVRVRGKLLRARATPLEGKLVVESNGGKVTIAITATVPVKPFTQGVLAGAATPRELAQKARTAPRDAAPLFEDGTVARWYQVNGWRYPVQLPPAAGIGAIQQFFEALGLVHSPRVELDAQTVELKGRPGEQAEHALALHATENLLVWASAISDQSWLEVGRTIPAGRRIRVPLLVRSIPNRPGEVLTARLTVTTNGNQQFSVPVRLEVIGTDSAAVVPTFPLVPSGPPPVEHAGPPSRRKRAAWLAVAFLLVGFLAAVLHDLLLNPDEDHSVAVAPLIDTRPRIALHFHDTEVDVKLGPSGIKPAEGEVDKNHIKALWEPSMRFGVTMVDQPDPSRPGSDKRLTYSERGLTNNTCIQIDGNPQLYGESPFRLQNGEQKGPSFGRWVEMKGDLGTDPQTELKIEGSKSVWLHTSEKIVVTQTVEVVPGEQSRLLDTCLVRYRIDNQDSQPHRVGLRMLLDSYIGANDGVPFTIPGEKHLCDTEMEFDDPRKIPDFIEALERPDLSNPGTVVHLGLKRHGPFDPPDRLTLGAWPNFRLHSRDRRCLQEKTLWEVPVLPIRTLTPPDSAVVIYWNENPLPPGKHREMAFTYGLGNVSSGETEGKLGVSIGGSFVEEGEFTVTAYVSRPSANERATLDLPDGFELLAGDEEQSVPPLPRGAASSNSPVTWRVRAPGKAGQYVLKVSTTSGVAQRQPIIIRPRGGIFN